VAGANWDAVDERIIEFFAAPPLEHAERFTVEARKQAANQETGGKQLTAWRGKLKRQQGRSRCNANARGRPLLWIDGGQPNLHKAANPCTMGKIR
jgi:hypothetical protein